VWASRALEACPRAGPALACALDFCTCLVVFLQSNHATDCELARQSGAGAGRGGAGRRSAHRGLASSQASHRLAFSGSRQGTQPLRERGRVLFEVTRQRRLGFTAAREAARGRRINIDQCLCGACDTVVMVLSPWWGLGVAVPAAAMFGKGVFGKGSKPEEEPLSRRVYLEGLCVTRRARRMSRAIAAIATGFATPMLSLQAGRGHRAQLRVRAGVHLQQVDAPHGWAGQGEPRLAGRRSRAPSTAAARLT
jgi:hypothetical protein